MVIHSAAFIQTIAQAIYARRASETVQQAKTLYARYLTHRRIAPYALKAKFGNRAKHVPNWRGRRQTLRLRALLLSQQGLESLLGSDHSAADCQYDYLYRDGVLVNQQEYCWETLRQERFPLFQSGLHNVENACRPVSLTQLQLPQHAPAVLKVQGMEMSEFITALKPKQFAMSGRVSGELSLLLDDATQLIPRGLLASNNLMTLRLDPQFADALAASDFATAATIDWLRYMKISRLRATLNLLRAGDLTLDANIAGTGANALPRGA